MKQQNSDDIFEAYREAYESIPQEAYDLDLRVTVQTIQALAEGQPVSAERLAEIWEFPVEQVQTVLAQAKTRGQVEIDDEGNVIGAVLSLVPTHHRVQVNGNDLYAWCAYDAIYVPGVLGQAARVESRDPISGAAISMTITPDGVTDVLPQGALVSVVGADVNAAGPAGPESQKCSQMLFFASRNTAETWIKDHPGVTILPVEVVYQMAREFQIEPARRLGLVGAS
jgi:alkylmercury lyase